MGEIKFFSIRMGIQIEPEGTFQRAKVGKEVHWCWD